MKILLVIDDISVIGGVERVICNIANTFFDIGYDVRILSFYRSNTTVAYPINSGVNIIYKFLSSESCIKSKYNTSILKKIYYKYLYKAILGFWVYKRFSNLDYIITSDWTFTPFLKHHHIKYLRLIHINFTKYNRRNNYFDTLIILSKLEIDKYMKYHNNIAVIPNFIPEIPLDITDSKQKVVISAGRMDRGDQKGFLRLIDIWKLVKSDSLLKDWKLHIVGDGISKKDIESKIKEHKLESSVTLKPFSKDINKEYLRASIYAMSSYAEGFGMVLVESASLGLPAIAFDVKVGPSDIIENDESGYLIEDNDIDGFANKLKILMKDEELRNKLGLKAKRLVANKFSKEAILPLWRRILDE